MEELSTADILQIIYSHLRSSQLAQEVGEIRKYKFYNNPQGEFIVIAPLANAMNNMQVATVNVNIYVPDLTPTVGGEEQRYPNDTRLRELSDMAIEGLKGYKSDRRFFFRPESETIITEENISYSFSNIKVKLINY